MCLDINLLIFYFIVLLLAVALGTAGIVWLVVVLDRRARDRMEREELLRSYE